MSAVTLRALNRPRRPLSQGLVSRRAQAHGDRRRVTCACARAKRATVARSGRRAGGCRDRLRQRRDRPSARANLHLRGLSEATLPDLHARLEDAGLIDADPEIERLRNIVASPLDDLDPEALSRSRTERCRPGKAARGGRSACGACRRSSASSLTRMAACRSATSTRTSASRRPRWHVAVFLAGEMRWPRECAPDEIGDVAARLGRAFLALAGAGEAAPRRMRALVERKVRRQFSRRPVAKRSRAGVHPDARRCATSSGCRSSARRSSSARPRPSARSTLIGSTR